MKMSKLQEKLNNLNLDEIRRSVAEDKVPLEFRKIAEAVFNGHFLVRSNMDNVKIYPTCIELYWHEEQGDIKDYIVYHRNSLKEQPPIFSLGVLNNHVSGIDLTFEHGENPETAIRASILIREYKVAKTGEAIREEKRPTWLYNDLYSQFSVFNGGFSLIWEDDENATNKSNADGLTRHNVAKYVKNNGRMVKEPYIAGKNAGNKTANGKYVQDERQWRFTLNDPEHDTRF